MRQTLWVLFLSLTPIGVAKSDTAADTLAEIARCSEIRDSVERLRCFDRVAPQARQAPSSKLEDFGKPPAPRPPEVAQLKATVRELARTPRGRAIFVLDNGQTWRQLDADSTNVLEPRPGEVLKVTIARGLFDSYDLAVDGRNGFIKVRRVQ